MEGELFAIGRIVGCFGVQGYCKLELFTDFPERLEKLKGVYIGIDAPTAVICSVENVHLSGTSARVKLEKIDDRTAAEQLIGQFIFITREGLRKLPKGRFYVHDLLGAEVVTSDGTYVGKIVDVYKFSAQDIWVVKDEGKEYLIPAVKEFIASVDIEKKIVVVRPIEGLLNG